MQNTPITKVKQRKSKHGELFAQLDALELYETWFVKELPAGGDIRSVSQNYNNNRKKSPGRMSYHSVKGGILFVRVA